MTLAVALALAAASASAMDLDARLAEVDAAWADRDRPEGLEAVRAGLERARAMAPDDYRVLWREARLDVWLSDDPATPTADRSRHGKRAWDAAERAIQLEPARVEGYTYAAFGMGNYALSLGILRALRDGIEAKFRSRMVRAEAIDRKFLAGAIPVAWGRYHDELPWPKRDARRSERYYRDALRVNPANARARVYLAELYLKEGKRAEARAELEGVLGQAPGAYDAPEERRMQARARQILARAR